MHLASTERATARAVAGAPEGARRVCVCWICICSDTSAGPEPSHRPPTARARRFKPAPLYILDEVDSALDLNHTQNIGRMIRQHFPQSQFLVVSLKEGMFSNANVIFRTKFVDGVSTVTRTTPSAAEAALRGAGPAADGRCVAQGARWGYGWRWSSRQSSGDAAAATRLCLSACLAAGAGRRARARRWRSRLGGPWPRSTASWSRAPG